MKKFIKDFLGNPFLPTLTVVLTILVLAFVVYSPSNNNVSRVTTESGINVRKNITTTKYSSSSELTPVIAEFTQASVKTGLTKKTVKDFSTQTRIITTTTTAVSTESTSLSSEAPTSTNEPHVYDFSYTSAGESPNSSYYQDRITIIGDSIAYGFYAYGYIPYEHNIAKESLAVWNMDTYYFDVGGGSMGVIDAADYVNSPLYYISIGMNDIYSYSAADYGTKILGIANQVLERVPTATVVIAAITPIADWNSYTSNSTIREFNSSMQTAVSNADNPQILFFDAYSALADPYSLALGDDHSGGDGMHLSGYSYQYILDCLFNFLDATNATELIQIHDTTAY